MQRYNPKRIFSLFNAPTELHYYDVRVSVCLELKLYGILQYNLTSHFPKLSQSMPGPTMRFAAGLCVIVVVLISPEVFCQDEPECICLEELRAARGLKNPVVLRSALDGTNRKFIAEQTGEVWIHMPDGVVLPKPFLNLTEIILTTDRFGDERGFLTLAFHPEYSVNGRVFIYYSLEIDGEDYTRLSEVTLYEGSEVEIDPESERILLDIPQPFANHNGGEVTGFMFLTTK